MDRVLVYPGQIPLETDILSTNKYGMVGLSKLAAAVFGTSTLLNAFTCIPTWPASLQVQVTAGEMYSLQNIDGTAYSSLAADTTHQIMKQGILLDTVTLSAPAPGTGGQSINYLVQVAYSDSDALPVVLPYYNASNPSQAYSGPNNAGTTNNTVRKGLATVSIKAGVAATTGSQVTPAPDAGNTGMFVVTVANGQTTITAGNISTLAGAPFITETLTQKISQAFADARYLTQSSSQITAVAGGTADALTAAFTPVITAVSNQTILVRAASANATTTPTINPGSGAITIVKGNNLPLTAGDIAGAGHWLELTLDATLGKAVLQNPATGIAISQQGCLLGAYRNFKADALGISNYNCVITADEVVLENSTNQYITVRAVNKTVNANGAVGAPLSIMSARAASTWYYRWLWYNVANGLTATLDTSSTAPTAPTGYSSSDYKTLLPGACRTDASGNTYLLQIETRGRRSQYVVLAGSNLTQPPVMASGASGTPGTTLTAVAVGAFVPPTASIIDIGLYQTASGTATTQAGPNSTATFYGYESVSLSTSTASTNQQLRATFLLESSNVYYASASAASAGLVALGWEDNI